MQRECNENEIQSKENEIQSNTTHCQWLLISPIPHRTKKKKHFDANSN